MRQHSFAFIICFTIKIALIRHNFAQLQHYISNLNTISLKKYIFLSERVLRLLEEAENNTKGLFTTMYKNIPLPSHHTLVANFFLELQLYVRQYDVDVGASVDRFFNDLFSIIFEHVLLDSEKIDPFNTDYQDCLSNIRSMVYPAPFANYPVQLNNELSRSLSVARLFLGSLDLMYQALDRTDNITLHPGCAEALTNLEFCGHCDGFLRAQPCQDFCLNVMHGCLVGVNDLHPIWSKFLDTLSNFVSTVSAIYNFEQIVPQIYELVANSIRYAISNVEEFYPSVSKFMFLIVMTID